MAYKDKAKARKKALDYFNRRKAEGTIKIHSLTCEWCNLPFQCRRKAQRFCDRKCFGLWSRLNTSLEKSQGIALKNKQQAKGRDLNKRGYQEILAPDHPMAGRNGYVLEHRLVMARHLGRMLDRKEIVHHRDGNKLNNHISNLELTDSKTHARRHHAQKVCCPKCDHVFRVADHPSW